MNFEELAIGWREALLALVVLLVLYIAIVVIRLRRLRKAATSALDAGNDAVAPADPIATAEPSLPGESARERDFPWNEPPELPPVAESALADRLLVAENDLMLVREELAAMRGELAAMREENTRALERLQAAQNVAPIYGDAMQMAAAGYDASAIAERCGVARAEAELVVALIRNKNAADTMRER